MEKLVSETKDSCITGVADSLMGIAINLGELIEDFAIFELKEAFGIIDMRALNKPTKEQMCVNDKIKKYKVLSRQMRRVIVLLKQKDIPHKKLQKALNVTQCNLSIFNEILTYIWSRRNKRKAEDVSKKIKNFTKFLLRMVNQKLRSILEDVKNYNREHKPLKLIFQGQRIKLPE